MKTFSSMSKMQGELEVLCSLYVHSPASIYLRCTKNAEDPQCAALFIQIVALHDSDGTRMGWMVMLVLVMAATMPPIVMERVDAAIVDKTAVAGKLAWAGV